MTRLIVNNTDTTPGIFFPFQSITVRDARGKKKCKNLLPPLMTSWLLSDKAYASRSLNQHRLSDSVHRFCLVFLMTRAIFSTSLVVSLFLDKHTSPNQTKVQSFFSKKGKRENNGPSFALFLLRKKTKLFRNFEEKRSANFH